MQYLLQYYTLSDDHHHVLGLETEFCLYCPPKVVSIYLEFSLHVVCLSVFRCWRVQWPKKDEFCCFNDANEVFDSCFLLSFPVFLWKQAIMQFYCIWLCPLFYAFAVWLLFCTFSHKLFIHGSYCPHSLEGLDCNFFILFSVKIQKKSFVSK